MIRHYLKNNISEKNRMMLRAVQQRLCWPLYIGTKYYCPCCNFSARKFLHYYGKDNIRCPRCNSVDRYRLLWLYFKEKTNLFSDELTVLHFAPENIISEHLKKLPNLNYTTADMLVSYMPMFCAMPDVEMDVCNIPFPDCSVDVVICNHVLEHVGEDGRAMGEIYRILKKGGWAVLQVPIDKKSLETLEDENINTDELRIKYYGSESHVRMYGLDYKCRLINAGFRVNVESYVKELERVSIDKYCLDDDEDIYVVFKD